jgi:hypothetical protein
VDRVFDYRRWLGEIAADQLRSTKRSRRPKACAELMRHAPELS